MIILSNKSNDFLNSTGKVLDIVPNVYADLAQPAAKEVGKTVSLIPRIINAALAPLRQWIVTKEYNIKETEALLAKKLENVNADRIVSPEPYVAVPAFEAISYSMDSKELRELFANLLSKSMYADTKNDVHPSFTDVIKQLSPLDVQVFKYLFECKYRPIIELKLNLPNNEGFYPLMSNITDISIGTVESIGISLSNLKRLNLIDISYSNFYTNDKLYEPLLKTEFVNTQKSTYEKAPYEFDFNKGKIDITDFGKLFYRICVQSL